MFDFNFSSSPDDSQSSTPKSDSELTNPSKDNPEMLWTWGELPQAAQVHNHTWLCLLGMAALNQLHGHKIQYIHITACCSCLLCYNMQRVKVK